MTCEEFLRSLDAGEALTSPAALAHRETCPSCAQAAARWEAVRRELRAMAQEEAPPFLHARVMAGLRDPAVARRRFPWLTGWRPAWAGAALVVGVLVILGGYGWWRTFAPPAELMVASRQKGAPAAPRRALEQRPGSAAVPPAPAVPTLVPLLESAQPTSVGKLAAKAQAPAHRRERRREEPPRPYEALPVGGEVAAGAAEEQRPAAAQREPVAVDRVETLAAPAAARATGFALKAAASDEERPAARVRCRLAVAAGGESFPVELAPADAPPQGEPWVVSVAEDGAMSVAGAGGQNLALAHPALAGRLRALHLPPGRYLLLREQ